MDELRTPQERMDAAFDNYFASSKVLAQDLQALLEIEDDKPHWRRNFLRASVASLEGYGHCLREMCEISLVCEAPQLSKKEKAVVLSEGAFGTEDRVRLTLRAAYKAFQLKPAPDFGSQGWSKASCALRKRHALMHPTSPSDLEVTDEFWAESYEGVVWMLTEFFRFFCLLQRKYSNEQQL